MNQGTVTVSSKPRGVIPGRVWIHLEVRPGQGIHVIRIDNQSNPASLTLGKVYVRLPKAAERADTLLPL